MRFASLALVLLLISPAQGQSNTAQELFDQSMVLLRQAKFEEMIAGCDAAIAEKKFPALAMGLKAIASTELGDNEAANTLIASAMESELEDPIQQSLLHSCHGFVQVRQGRHNEALKSAKEAIKFAKDLWFPHYVKAYAHDYRGQTQECMDAVDECLKLAPRQPMALMLRGICQSNRNNETDAFTSMAGAMQSDPNFVWGAWMFAMELASRGSYDTAAQLLDSVEQVNDHYSPLLSARAFLHLVQSETEEQEACLNKAWEINDRHIESLTSKGFFLIRAGRFDEAKPIVDRCIEAYPDSFHSYLMLGVFRSGQEQIDEAVEAYEQAAQLNPTHFRPHLYLGMIYFDNEKYEQAVAPYRKLKELNPTYWFGIFNLGKAYAKLGQHKKAIEEFTDALDLVDDYGSTYAERAYSYEAIGESAKAESDFEKAKELGWDESWRD